MARIIIASASEESGAQLSRLLASSGFPVFRRCGSGGELRRTISECGDAIVLMAGILPDCKPDELQLDWGDCVEIMLLGKPALLTTCDSPQVFRLALPASGQAVIGAVEMLSQLHRMRLPKRSGADRQLVEKAKGILMRTRGLTESEAHRAMQQYAMRHGVKMADYAARIIQSSMEE